MNDTKPIVDFQRAAGSDNYHIVERGKNRALCGFEPVKGPRSRWIAKYHGEGGEGERPYFPRICWKCAKKANLDPSTSPDNATVRYGVGV